MDSTLATPKASFPIKRLLLSYSIVTLGAGHGALPAGLLLGFGAQWILEGHDATASMLTIVLAGWLGVGVLGLMAIPVFARRVPALFLVGSSCLVISILALLGASEVLPITAATAVPFSLVLGRALWSARRARTSHGRASGVDPLLAASMRGSPSVKRLGG